MSSRTVVIVGASSVVYVALAFLSTPLFLFVSVAAFWAGLWFGSRWAVRRWRNLPYLQRAVHISDIRRVEYFRRVSRLQLETWVITALTAPRSVLLGDPIVGRSKEQGFFWLEGKKAVIFMRLEQPLLPQDLAAIYDAKNKLKADRALVISPFDTVAEGKYPGVEVLSGKKLLALFSHLSGARPLNIGSLPLKSCSCGAAFLECVSVAGEPMRICARYPDCQQSERALLSPEL